MMQIGQVTVNGSFFLAPLAGYTDLPFRLLCREHGAALCFSEMVSCHGLCFGQKKTLALLQSDPLDQPLAVQLFGSDPEIMGRAAALVSDQPVQLIDINMGCPVRKVVRKGAGAALMKDPDRAAAIIRAVCANTTLPVTVKFRSGWNSDAITAPEFARMAEEAGAAAVTVHARTWAQGFGGRADWRVIGQVRRAVAIPVIGNGDILCHEDGLRMMAETGCDGVMIGRGALGNPWVFARQGRPVTLEERLPAMRRHLALTRGYLQQRQAVFRMKNHAVRYLAGLRGASRIRQRIMACHDLDALDTLLRELEGATDAG
ncbi:MAG TPA: tRNA dihydrouridine synthase DusB [Desulfobulbus sp.]|nr:tRNA dihydrouridine synthase DusB [Desulfobulbus sp.]